MSRPSPVTITTGLALHLVVADGSAVPVEALLRYDSSDPYAVHVAFRTGGEDLVEWTFARQLLADGVLAVAGEGDVSVWPLVDDDRPEQLLCLALSSPSGAALFEAPAAAVVTFLAQTYAAVPAGAESGLADLDAELALLMWSGAGE